LTKILLLIVSVFSKNAQKIYKNVAQDFRKE